MKLLKHKSQKRLHLTHGLVDPYQKSTTDNRVPNVELVQMRQSNDFSDIGVVNTVARINYEAEIMRKFGTPTEYIKFSVAACVVVGITVGTSV